VLLASGIGVSKFGRQASSIDAAGSTVAIPEGMSQIVGLTGSDEQTAAEAQAYRVYYSPAQHEQSGADIVSHSTFLYLMTPNGKLDALFPQDIGDDQLTAALRARLSSSKQAEHPS
jgi:hypothetical protein